MTGIASEVGADTEYRPVALCALAEEIDRLACREASTEAQGLLWKLARLARDTAKGFEE